MKKHFTIYSKSANYVDLKKNLFWCYNFKMACMEA